MFSRKTVGIRRENAIAELKSILVGGVEQWLLIRGEDQSLPVLLFLHGGPGTSQIGIIADYQKELEKHFIVVNWDQRGAGLSYSKKIPQESMKVDRLLEDTFEVTNYLREEFQQDKIYLIGHSWGTILGLWAIHRHPEWYHHYIGVSQVISVQKTEELSYQLVLEKAKEQEHQKAITQLNEMGKPPWSNMKNDRIHQKYLESFRGGISHDGKLIYTLIKKMLKSKEYSLFDIFRFVKGQFFSMNNLIDEMRRIDLSETIQSVEVPITLMMGRHDLTTPPEAAREWFDSLQAKNKTWLWFENSAHSPLFEENQRFVDIISKL
ncbi:alpha/beta fold hydrolase [Lysinibacillus sp. NPDC094403]|uniref:alpha/beta fold hydrolase n=1 Tax=Lysinibacillus sp. NPDC094403 TaxID=3390581 RepID=UPI003CFF67E3